MNTSAEIVNERAQGDYMPHPPDSTGPPRERLDIAREFFSPVSRFDVVPWNLRECEMPGLDHLAADEQEPHDPHTAGRNARYGLVLFAAYSFVYAAFVLLSAFRPDWMAAKPWAGVNLAVLSGLGLILGAFLLALVYGWLCRAPALPREGRHEV